MPQIQTCSYNFSKGRSGRLNIYHQNEMKWQKIKRNGSKISIKASNNQKGWQKDNIKRTQNNLKLQAENDRQRLNRQKNHLTQVKVLSKKLFQKAKVIENPQKETYLSPHLYNLEKSGQGLPDQRHVSSPWIKIPIIKSEKKSLKDATQQKNSMKKVLSHRNIPRQKQDACAQPAIESKNKGLEEPKFELDEKQKQQITKNNLFKSSLGRQLLQSLEKKLRQIGLPQKGSEDKVNTGSEDELKNQQQPDQNCMNQYFKLLKVASIEFNSDMDSGLLEDIGSECKKETLPADEQGNDQGGRMSSFSRLIIDNDYLQEQKQMDKPRDLPPVEQSR